MHAKEKSILILCFLIIKTIRCHCVIIVLKCLSFEMTKDKTTTLTL